jgi:hypothetical protein
MMLGWLLWHNVHDKFSENMSVGLKVYGNTQTQHFDLVSLLFVP